MVEDQDGNVIAISYEDLSILRRSKASTLAKIQGFGGARLTGVTGGANGRIWIITEGAGLYSLFRNTLVGIGKNTGLGNPNLWSILEDSKGRIWAGSWGEGLYNGWPDSFAPEQNWLLPDRRMVTAIIQARDGGIWAGTGEGLGRRSEQGWDWYVRSGDTLIGNVRTLCEGKDGRIWFGTTGNGVGYVEKGVPTLIAPDSDAGCRYVNCILPDADDGIWVGTEGAGLFHWAKGRWTHLRTEDGLPSNDLFHMANDCEGRIWFTSSAGVFFVQSDELACFVTRETGTIHPTIINREDGLPSDQCAGGSQNAAYLDADGRYYVPTSGGLAMIDTRASQAEEKHLHPSINRVFVDDKEVLQPDSDPLRCPPRTQSLRVEYSAPTLTHPNLVKYAYRLDGDRSSPWVQLGSSRSLQIQRPPAGLHKLEIIAWSSGLMEQAPTTTILVEQEPTLTEMLWFRVLILSLVLSAMAGAVWFYTRRTYIESQRKLELETAIEKERRRIARDIHDELGVLLAQVMLLIQGGKPVQDSGLEAGLLSRLHTKAKEITKALDELVWTINPSYDTLEGLVLYISRLSQETISNAGLRCRLRINEPADDVALDSGARHQLIMCLKEAIANAIKHSGCTQIEVMLSVEQGILKLAVHDNGCGFTPVMAGSPSPADTDHSGCDNMHARMNELGGRLVLESSPGQGTRVLFEYPLPLQ
jgi:signal transduction histidine kinase